MHLGCNTFECLMLVLIICITAADLKMKFLCTTQQQGLFQRVHYLSRHDGQRAAAENHHYSLLHGWETERQIQ